MNFGNIYIAKIKTPKTTRSSRLKIKSAIRKIPLVLLTVLILLQSSLYPVVQVYAMADPTPTPNPLQMAELWTVIEGGAGTAEGDIVNQVVKAPFIFGSEIDTGFALYGVATTAYWEEMNAEINYKINNGTLSYEDVGYVYYKVVNGQNVPVAVVRSALYGANEYLITEELAQQIIDQQLTEDAEVQQAVLDYWERVYISDTQPFIDMASDLKNWTCKWTHEISDTARDVYARLFGRNLMSPNSNFYSDHIWARCIDQYDTLYTYNVGDSIVNPDFEYIIIHVPDLDAMGQAWAQGREGYYLWYYDPSWNTFMFQKATELTPYRDLFKFVNFPPGMASTTVSYERYQAMIQSNVWPPQIGFSEIFPYWEGLALLDPSLEPEKGYVGLLNVDDVAQGVQALDEAVEDIRENNPDLVGIPVVNPEAVPELDPVLDPEPFINPLPEEYPALDPVGGVITPPGGSGGGGDDSGGGGDDSGGGGDEDRPELKIPDLLELFPFCIPFDIKNAITLMSDGGEWTQPEAPTFDIPFNIEYGGRTIVNYTFHLDLSEYEIWVALGYIRTFEVICFIIILAIATGRVLF